MRIPFKNAVSVSKFARKLSSYVSAKHTDILEATAKASGYRNYHELNSVCRAPQATDTAPHEISEEVKLQFIVAVCALCKARVHLTEADSLGLSKSGDV